MANTTVGEIIDRFRSIIIDEGDTDFSDTEALFLYNQANRRIIALRPHAYTRIESFQLVAGSKQMIPSDGLKVVNIIRNMGTDGTTAGNAIRPTNGGVMAAVVPGYSAETQQAEVWDWWPVDDFPEQFYVDPPNDGTGYVECEYAKLPPDTVYDSGGSWESETLPLSAWYNESVLLGMLYMAYDDDTDIPGNTPKSAKYYTRFLHSLGVGIQTAKEGAE